MVSSRKQHNVDKAVEKLKEDSINVAGMVCHVGKEEDRKQLIQEVSSHSQYGLIYEKILNKLILCY